MAVRIWLWLSVLASVAGWGLSAVGQLNRMGYAAFFGVGALFFWFGRKSLGWGGSRRIASSWRKWGRRFRRPWPCCFLILSVLVFLGGALYPPTNHAAFTYRIPRVLHWLAEGQWHWIDTVGYRMNNRACGMEWLSAPLLLFTKSDRGLFLLNFIPFLLLPGLIFSLFTRLGVRPRVAWHWMWLLPTGYTFLLQAGSAGNDAFPSVYALAAVDFGCRAWVSRRPSDLCLSVLSAALVTGAKASNLPLLLPWVIIVMAVVWRAVAGRSWSWRSLAVGAGLVLLAGLVSFLPTAALNMHYCHDWSGLKLERAGMDLKSPWVGLWGNGLLFLLDNLVPPIFPAAGWWNAHALSVLPPGLVGPLTANFENGFHQLKELPTEDWAGLGFGGSILVLVSVVAGWWKTEKSKEQVPMDRDFASSRGRSKEQETIMPAWLRRWVMVAVWVALLAYCLKSGMSTGARLITPYYPLLLPLLLIGKRQEEIVRRRWWRLLAWGVAGLAFAVLILTPGRPLWPAQTVLTKAVELRPDRPLFARALNVYAVYAGRSDPLAKVREMLPPGVRVTGFLADGDDIDISFWRPFFERRVKHVRLADSAAAMRARRVQYVVVGGAYLEAQNTTFAEWQRRTGAKLVGTATATLKAAEGPQAWYLARLPDFN